jgi:hypothetical protein
MHTRAVDLDGIPILCAHVLVASSAVAEESLSFPHGLFGHPFCFAL